MVKNERGQQTLEAILLLVVFLAMSLAFSRSFQSRNLFARVISDPWDWIAGMTESGVWAKSSAARDLHPTHLDRHWSPRGTPAKEGP